MKKMILKLFTLLIALSISCTAFAEEQNKDETLYTEESIEKSSVYDNEELQIESENYIEESSTYETEVMTPIQEDSISEIEDISQADILTEGFEIIDDKFTSADDIKTYHFKVDFTNFDTVCVALIKKENSYISIEVKDSVGNIKKMDADGDVPKNRLFITKGDKTIEEYEVTVKVKKYIENSSSFRVVYGEKSCGEQMLQGQENAATIEWYLQKEDNWFLTGLTPNAYEHWYVFTANTSNVTFTFAENNDNLRFCVREYDNKEIKIYDSRNDVEAHKKQFCGGFDHVEKSKLNLVSGKKYYLVLFSEYQFSNEGIVEDSVSASVGNPWLHMGMLNYARGTNKISVNSKSFSGDAIIRVGDNGLSIPKTAFVTRVQYVVQDANISASNLAYWKIKAPQSTWKTSGLYRTNIDYTYQNDSLAGININGEWRVEFKSTKNNYQFTPGLYIRYQYELGD